MHQTTLSSLPHENGRLQH